MILYFLYFEFKFGGNRKRFAFTTCFGGPPYILNTEFWFFLSELVSTTQKVDPILYCWCTIISFDHFRAFLGRRLWRTSTVEVFEASQYEATTEVSIKYGSDNCNLSFCLAVSFFKEVFHLLWGWPSAKWVATLVLWWGVSYFNRCFIDPLQRYLGRSFPLKSTHVSSWIQNKQN